MSSPIQNLKSWFENPGQKIKSLAFTLFIIDGIGGTTGGFVAVIVSLIGMVFEADVEGYIFILIGGIVMALLSLPAAWVANILLYAFGELVENSGKKCVTAPATEAPTSAKPINTPNASTNTNQAASTSASTVAASVATKKTEKTVSKEAVESARPAQPPIQPIASSSPQHLKLRHALRFTTDDGMLNYLRNLNAHENSPRLKEILQLPPDQIRTAVQKLITELESEENK